MDLDIVKIYDKFLYSVKYEEADENEYDRLFNNGMMLRMCVNLWKIIACS